MRRRIWFVLVVAGLIAAGCGSSGDETSSPKKPAAAAEPAAPDASPYVAGFGDLSVVALPAGDPGAVTIIEGGDTIDRSGIVSTIVRNNTSDAVGEIKITGTARDSSGALVGSGSGSLTPAVVAPGEIAYGYVYFGDDIPAGSTFKSSVDAEPVGEHFLPVTVTEVNNTGNQIVGAVTNDLDVEVRSIKARVVCFDTSGDVLGHEDSFVEPADLSAHRTGSFAIDLSERPCPVGLAAADGYSGA